MKRFALSVLCLFFIPSMINPLSVNAKTTFKLATVTPPHHAYALGAEEFARLVKEATRDEVIVKIYPGGQLGKGERELLEGLGDH
ncbi:MAG: hypothetical protein MUO52_03515 [Desulfobacterales bacterium]|nr:hypothetical protein [Desulfobacterales bacterium]